MVMVEQYLEPDRAFGEIELAGEQAVGNDGHAVFEVGLGFGEHGRIVGFALFLLVEHAPPKPAGIAGQR